MVYVSTVIKVGRRGAGAPTTPVTPVSVTAERIHVRDISLSGHSVHRRTKVSAALPSRHGHPLTQTALCGKSCVEDIDIGYGMWLSLTHCLSLSQ